MKPGVDATTDAACTTPFGCGDASFLDVAPPPPPVLCPATVPVLNMPCSVPNGEDCEYGTQSYSCNQHFICVAGEWKKNFSIVPLSCDAGDTCGSVVDGGACVAAGRVCPNGDASICVCSECGAGPPPDGPNAYWQCFSPGAGCATDRANVGTACDVPDGSVCEYTRGGCCTGEYQWCTDGVWIGEATEPCP